MKGTHEIRFVHTKPCSVCRGNHPEYRSRMWCRGCRSLRDNMERGLLPKPAPLKPPKSTPVDLTEKIFALQAKGLTLREISEAVGLSENAISSRIYRAHKVSGTVRRKKWSAEI